MDNTMEWTRHKVRLENTEALQERDGIIALRDKRISGLKDDLEHKRERRGQARRDFLRARDERDELAAQVATMTATIDV